MTDQEREAQIRRDYAGLNEGHSTSFLLRLLDEERENNADLQRTFDLMWAADQRAIKAWQEANPGNDMVWPDRSKLTGWLLEQIARLTAPPSASAMEEACGILNAAQNTIGDPASNSPTSSLEMLRDDIARALEAAERRGAERMREAAEKEAGKYADNPCSRPPALDLTLDAYTIGATDNAMAIESAIQTLSLDPDQP